MLGRLGAVLNESGAASAILSRVLRPIHSQAFLVQQQHSALDVELFELNRALDALTCPVLLLKGAAYVALGLEAGKGRQFSDIDILVPHGSLGDVEAALMLKGWVSTHRDAYDQRYYRQWMHEIPPMVHIRRGTALDVHHALTPPTSRIRADSDAMLTNAREIPGWPGFKALAPADMVLHSATHLFLEGELEAGLRDLFDLEALLREFSAADPNFPISLVDRAEETGLRRPLFYALRYLQRIIGVEISANIRERVRGWGPAFPPLVTMDALFDRALVPHHSTCQDWLTPAALFALYIRGHWLRMPAYLLVVHLLRKAFKRDEATEPEAARKPAQG